MKSLRAILSCFFALLVFLSSSTFSFGIHSCGGQVKAIAFLDKADGCGHGNMPPCHRKLMDKCCDDEVVTHQGQGFDHQIIAVHAAAPVFVMIAPPVLLLSDVIPSAAVLPKGHTDYDPPLPTTDRIVSLQTFLI